MGDNAPAGTLFHDVVFTILPDGELDRVDMLALETAITNQGGRFIPLVESDQSIPDISELTHILSTHVDFPQYRAALEHGVYVVKPAWVRHSLERGKQASARQYSPDPSQIFHDVVFSCGTLPAGDLRAITAGVMVFGGQYSGPLTKLVTHIITTDIEHERCQIAIEKRLNVEIVLPHWIDACLKLGKRISERPYRLPDPEIMREHQSGAIRSAAVPQLYGATHATPTRTSLPLPTPQVSPSKSRKSLSAFTGKKIFLSEDLEISDHVHSTIRNLVQLSGGSLVDEVDSADIYIGQFRDGLDYVTASRAGKEVANLSWLYHVIQLNRYTSPLSKLLHYPIPRGGIPGFEHMKISISNYSGDARTYVENLVRYCGAEFTKTMKQDNTHLITAHKQSEKCEAAQEWNINIVNHLWLEESYAKCTVQTLSNPKYTTFPARTNLGEVAGQTALDMKSVERSFFPPSRRASPVKSKSPVKSTKSGSLPAVAEKRAVSNDSGDGDVDIVAPADEDEDEAAPEPPTTAKKQRGRPRKDQGTPRVVQDNKENESPVVTSVGRASKAKALNSLHEQAGDIALFQKEMKRKGGVTHGGRFRAEDAVNSPTAPPSRSSRKRTSDEFDGDHNDQTDSGEGSEDELSLIDVNAKPSHKKAKTTTSALSLPPITCKMMVTGYERWKDDKNLESTDRDKLRLLGIALTTDPTEVDMLVAPRLLRTRKFVSALARAPVVVSTKYLDIALSKSKLPSSPSHLIDRDGEDKLGFTLSSSLSRARENAGKLFRGWAIFVTKDVIGGYDTYEEIIKVNGGEAHLYTGRTGMALPKRRIRQDPESGTESQNQGGEEEFDFVYLVSGTSEAEKKLWDTFRKMARKQDLEARIVTTDWLLNAAMSQRIAMSDKWLL